MAAHTELNHRLARTRRLAAGPGASAASHAMEPAPGSLVDQAHRLLEELFVTTRLPPGKIVTETELCALTGIGRTPVREAVQRMAKDQLVMILRGHGIRVPEIDIQVQLLVLEPRRELERLISARAARRSSERERAEMFRIADALEVSGRADDVLVYLRHHFTMKSYIARCARNPYAAWAVAPLYTLSRRFYFHHHREIDNLAEGSALNAELTRTIAAGEESRAVKLTDGISDYVEAITRRLLQAAP